MPQKQILSITAHFMKNAGNERELVRPTFLQENEINDAISITVITLHSGHYTRNYAGNNCDNERRKLRVCHKTITLPASRHVHITCDEGPS